MHAHTYEIIRLTSRTFFAFMPVNQELFSNAEIIGNKSLKEIRPKEIKERPNKYM